MKDLYKIWICKSTSITASIREVVVEEHINTHTLSRSYSTAVN